MPDRQRIVVRITGEIWGWFISESSTARIRAQLIWGPVALGVNHVMIGSESLAESRLCDNILVSD